MTHRIHSSHVHAWLYPWLILRAILAYALLPNLPFWIAATLFPVREPLNLDYLAIAVAAVFLRRSRTLTLLSAAIVLQALSLWLAFYFRTGQDAVFSARYLADLPWTRILAATAILILSSFALAACTVAAAGHRWSQRRLPSALIFTGLLVSLVALTALTSDTLNRAVWHSDHYRPKIFSSVVFRLLRSKLSPGIRDPAVFSGGRIPSATAAYLDRRLPLTPAHGPPPNLVLVIVESYGLVTGSSLRAQLVAPFARPDVTQRYVVQFGDTPYLGTTISGEFRELCGLQLPASAIRDVPAFAPGCLPRTLGLLGYRSSAFHGYVGGMYDRDRWWKQIGFQQTYFYDDLAKQPDTATCGGAFPGVCDADMVRSIRHTLLAAPPGQPQFIHWVTLNSHLPISPSDRVEQQFHCGQSSALVHDTDLCRWAGLILLVNQAIADLATDPALPPTNFVIVGDHAPPFLSEKHRSQFSYTRVPTIYLTSK